MLHPRFVLPLIAAAAFTVAGALAQTNTTTTTRSMSVPPTGLASSETAQINVVNLARNPTSGPAASCTGSISFLNASGTAFGSATSFTVTAGQTFSAKLPYASTAASGRTTVRGVVSLTITRGSGVPCQLSSSMETFDSSTGVTHVFVPGPQAGSGFGPPPGGPGR